jgi:type I restriction enzyme S subunit
MENKEKNNVMRQTEIGQIPEDWSIATLSSIVLKITKGTTPTTIGGRYVDKGINFVKVESLDEYGKLDKEKFAFIDEVTHELLSRSILEENDLLYSISGTIGRIAIVTKAILPANTNQDLAIVKPNLDKIDLHYLRYALANPKTKNYLVSRVVHGVRANLNLTELGNCPIPLPEPQEQQAISKILSVIDSKLELNHQINECLEKISRTFFQRWFVDFEYPNDEGKPYRSSGGEMVYNEKLDKEIPEGWRVKPIDEIADFLNGLALQKFPARDGEEYLPVIKIRELRQGITESSDKANLDLPEEYIVNNGDVLFSWSGSLEVVIWGFGKGALNQHLFKVTSSKYPKWFFYYWILHYLPEYRQIAADKATTMGHIQRRHLSASQVIVPDDKTLERMNKLLAPVLERISGIKVETKVLSEIRDLFLPKLMSGKIRIPVQKEKMEAQ